MEKPIDTRPTFIYTLSDPDTLEVRYVGKTVQELPVRLYQHVNDKRHVYRTIWIKSIVKKGLTPIITLVEVVPYNESWEDRERFWISYYKSNGAKLVNITDGGGGTIGFLPSNESRKRMSESQKNRSRKRMSDDVKEKIREGHFGKRNGVSRSVLQYDKEGNLIRIWDCAMDAEREIGVKQTSISQCCSGKKYPKYAGGYIWRYNDNKPIGKSSMKKQVLQYTPDMQFLKRWDSVSDASKCLDISKSSISQCCNGKKLRAGGYIWRFLEYSQ